ASAEIYNQPERQRDIDTMRKERNFLRDSIFKDFDIVFGETVHQRTTRIARGKSNVHQLDVNPKRLLAKTDCAGHEKQRQHRCALKARLITERLETETL